METGAISDSQIIASSEFRHDHGPRYARLHSTAGVGSWVPGSNDVNQWLGIDLVNKTKLTGVATQGRASSHNWVTSYKLEYSDDMLTTHFYREQGESVDKVLKSYSCSTVNSRYSGHLQDVVFCPE